MSLSEFIINLGSADSGWHEWHVTLGTELAAALSAQEWQELAVRWQVEAAWWQERCCEALGDGRAPESTPILAAMLHSAPDAVAVIAVSQLLDRGWAPTALDVHRLKSLRKLGRRLDDIDALMRGAAGDA